MNPVTRRRLLQSLAALGAAAGAQFSFAVRHGVFHCHNLEHAELGMMNRHRVKA